MNSQPNWSNYKYLFFVGHLARDTPAHAHTANAVYRYLNILAIITNLLDLLDYFVITFNYSASSKMNSSKAIERATIEYRKNKYLR